MLKNLLAVALIATAPVLQAQVRVVESSPQGFGSGVAQPSIPASAESDVYSQIRSLQEEISTLRGLVEEQSYELKQLKQLQLDNYMDLDRRLSGGANSVAPAASVEPLPAKLPSRSVVAENASEADVYKAAYDLLNQKDFAKRTGKRPFPRNTDQNLEASRELQRRKRHQYLDLSDCIQHCPYVYYQGKEKS